MTEVGYQQRSSRLGVILVKHYETMSEVPYKKNYLTVFYSEFMKQVRISNGIFNLEIYDKRTLQEALRRFIVRKSDKFADVYDAIVFDFCW